MVVPMYFKMTEIITQWYKVRFTRVSNKSSAPYKSRAVLYRHSQLRFTAGCLR
jgi:hypothetical protein